MKIIIVGDVIEDNYYFCRDYKEIDESINKASKLEREVFSLGAAGNVANTITSLLMEENVDILFFTSCNATTQSKILALPRIEYNKHPTIKRDRFYFNDQLRFRIDKFDDLYLNVEVNHKQLTECISSNDIIVISDYRKGFLNAEDVKKIVAIGNKNKCKIFVDTIELDDCYNGCTYLQVNAKTFNRYLEYDTDSKLEAKILYVAQKFNFNLIVTNSSDNIIYTDRKNVYSKKFYVPKQFKCSIGAGDVFLSGLAIAAYRNKKSIHDYVESADRYATMSTTFIGTTQLVNNKMQDKIALTTKL